MEDLLNLLKNIKHDQTIYLLGDKKKNVFFNEKPMECKFERVVKDIYTNEILLIVAFEYESYDSIFPVRHIIIFNIESIKRVFLSEKEISEYYENLRNALEGYAVEVQFEDPEYEGKFFGGTIYTYFSEKKYPIGKIINIHNSRCKVIKIEETTYGILKKKLKEKHGNFITLKQI